MITGNLIENTYVKTRIHWNNNNDGLPNSVHNVSKTNFTIIK